MDGLLLFHSLA